jgi:hypothetical protein
MIFWEILGDSRAELTYRLITPVGHRQEIMPRRELIPRTLVLVPAHGQTIAHAIERGSDDMLQVYPALH